MGNMTPDLDSKTTKYDYQVISKFLITKMYPTLTILT